jgi:hypothetical protein
MRILRLHLRGDYWYQVKAGKKPLEYRLVNAYWQRRLIDRHYDEVHLLLGYPKRDDHSKVLKRRWAGNPKETQLLHPEFGDQRVKVYAIDVTQEV